MQEFDARDGNGISAEELFGQPSGLTFDDIIILPPFSQVAAKTDVSLGSDLAMGFPLHLPMVSSPMDTVTEWACAIEMALQGGIGIIHMNLPADQAAEQVRRVKRYQMGIIDDPVCRRPDQPISEVDRVKSEFGFSTILITEDGTRKSKLLGMVTKGHVALETDKTKPLQAVMIPREKLMVVTADQVTSWSQARDFLRQEPVAHKVPILDLQGHVAGFVTRRDVVKMAQCPNALYDQKTGQLRVGAAVSTHERDDERVDKLLEANVDVLVVDSAQGGSAHAVRRIEYIRRKQPTIPIIAGNVVSPSQAIPLLESGATALRVGMGSGSICTTQQVIGVGRAQLSAVYHVSQAVREKGITAPIIADGGIRNSGDMMKAFACGASVVMVGRLIAGCEETPARLENHQGRRLKRYRGMGSPGAIQEGGRFRYGNTTPSTEVIAQGTEGLVPAAGPLQATLAQMAAAIRTGLEYLGCTSITELHRKVHRGEIRFELRSEAARTEGSPHDITEV